MSLPPDITARLDRFLDGLMSPEEAAAFEREMAANAEIAAQAELQKRIDGSLRRIFEYEGGEVEIPAPAPLPIAQAAKKSTRARWGVWGMWGAIAAGLMIAAVYMNWPRREFTYIPPEAMYSRLQRTGWNPAFTCKTDAEFVEKVRARLGQGLLIPMDTVGVLLDGWGYGDSYQGSPLSPDTMILMAHVAENPGGPTPAPGTPETTEREGKEVLLFIDKKGNARDVKVPPESGLRVFEARRGGLVLYEVTPLDRPALIDAAVEK